MSKAVCNINTSPKVQQPKTPLFPSIPRATDLPSALQAINGMNLILQGLLNQLPQLFPALNGTSGKDGQPGKSNSGSGGGGGVSQGGNFVEVPGTRQTRTQKITNPKDSSQYVTVQQVTAVTFANGFGQTLQWNDNS